MTEPPKPPPASADPARAALEDLVYRPSLAEGNRAVRGASPWLTLPVSLAATAALAALGYGLAVRARAGTPAPPSVELILQEGPEPAHPPGGPGPRPGPPAAPPRAPEPAPAPVPEPLAKPAPAPEARESVPEAAPRELPREDLSGTAGQGTAGAGSGSGGVPGGTGGSGGAGAGAGAGGGGGAGQGALPDLTQVARVKFKPPDPEYPPMARNARIQGAVVLEVTLGPDGVPVQARALSGPYALRAGAEAWALAWRFHPYLQNGVPHAGIFMLTVSFRIK